MVGVNVAVYIYFAILLKGQHMCGPNMETNGRMWKCEILAMCPGLLVQTHFSHARPRRSHPYRWACAAADGVMEGGVE